MFPSFLLVQISFCTLNQIHHFYTYAIQVEDYAFSTIIILGLLVFTMASYATILVTILAYSHLYTLQQRYLGNSEDVGVLDLKGLPPNETQ
ncbi:hypothetical protein HPG69_008872 [Diceros bicornis minor]|uniref:Uncharacterized protein n=1 Tax=Diceros bicornis minor TaxID=77932 RepID=A0A7J7FBC6_DICBM|nr:hypothetical protein HPG69_008872 [Diceros bicornis minor]